MKKTLEKGTWKLFPLFLICLLAMTVCPALAEFELPADTVCIETAAFLNDTSMTGVVQIPDTCTTIGSLAFAGTRIFGASLSPSVTEIGFGAFTDNPALTWIVIGNSQALPAERALDGIPIVIGPADSEWIHLLSEETYFCPLEALVEEDGFYYQILDSENAILLCPVDAANIDTDYFSPYTIRDVPLTGMTKYAFSGCSHLKRIWIEKYYTGVNEKALLSCPDARLLYSERYLYRVENNTLSLHHDVRAELQDGCMAAVGAVSTNGGSTVVTADGSISSYVVNDYYDHGGATGMDIYAAGAGSSVTAAVGNGIVAVSHSTNAEDVGNIDTAGVSVTVSGGGNADVTINGGIFADSIFDLNDDGYGWTAGLHLGVDEGTSHVRINGDVTANSYVYGVGLNLSMNSTGKASALVEVMGNVTGQSLGIRAQCADPAGIMEVVVDGTLSGTDVPVNLEEPMKENFRLTVWKAIHGKEGHIVSDLSEDESAALSNSEKAVQYIIRTGQTPFTLTGVEEYRGYLIAHEGDTVTARLPEGMEAESVWMDEAQTVQIQPDLSGAYTFTVPSGGGVVLSVKTK